MNLSEWYARITGITNSIFVSEVACRAYPYIERYDLDCIISLLTPGQRRLYDAKFPVHESFKGVHLNFDVDDHSELDLQLIRHMVESFSKRTLVHCISGANRSTFLTIARLVYEGMTLSSAYNHYMSTRGRALAEVYKAPPLMTIQMVGNLDRYYSSLICQKEV